MTVTGPVVAVQEAGKWHDPDQLGRSTATKNGAMRFKSKQVFTLEAVAFASVILAVDVVVVVLSSL